MFQALICLSFESFKNSKFSKQNKFLTEIVLNFKMGNYFFAYIQHAL